MNSSVKEFTLQNAARERQAVISDIARIVGVHDRDYNEIVRRVRELKEASRR